MITAAIILNYNDAEASVRAAERIKDFKILDYIIIADNASTDRSREIIDRYVKDNSEGKIIFIKSERNGGYGCGNNAGVRCAEKIGCTHAVISNPDSVFDEKLLIDMLHVFEQEEYVGAVGAVMSDDVEHFGYEQFISSCWPLRGTGRYMLYACPILKRVFKRYLNYKKEYFEKIISEAKLKEHEYIKVDAVHGSLLTVDISAFSECGGYDENIFLYCEEDILAYRLKQCGYKTFCTINRAYMHEGSHSITGSGNSAVKRQLFRQESERYYFKEYLKAGVLKRTLFRMLQFAVIFETKLAAAFGMMR